MLSKANIKRLEKWKNIIPLEIEEQENFVDYMEILKNMGKVCKFTAIPHETPTKKKSVNEETWKVSWVWGWTTNLKNTKKWVRAGLPDLFIIYQKLGIKKAVFIEMKRVEGSKVSPEQKEWIKLLNETEGLQAYVANWFQEAKKILDKLIFDKWEIIL